MKQTKSQSPVQNGEVLDYETAAEIKITVRVQDDGNGRLTDTCTLTVLLQDVNEVPHIPDSFIEIEENSVVGETVGFPLQGVDVDAGDILKYEIRSGNTDDAFNINVQTGQLRVAKKILNYEALPDFKLTVRVTDSGQLYDEATIFIALKDVNDVPVLGAMQRELVENAARGTLVGTAVVGSDEDALEELEYSIVAGNCPGGSPSPGTVEFLPAPVKTPDNLDMTFSVKTGANARIVLATSAPADTTTTAFTLRNGANFCLHYGWPLAGAVSNPADVNSGRRVDLWTCGSLFVRSQAWINDARDGRLRLASAPRYCLHVWNANQGLGDNQRIGLWKCAAEYDAHQRWAPEVGRSLDDIAP